MQSTRSFNSTMNDYELYSKIRLNPADMQRLEESQCHTKNSDHDCLESIDSHNSQYYEFSDRNEEEELSSYSAGQQTLQNISQELSYIDEMYQEDVAVPNIVQGITPTNRILGLAGNRIKDSGYLSSTAQTRFLSTQLGNIQPSESNITPSGPNYTIGPLQLDQIVHSDDRDISRQSEIQHNNPEPMIKANTMGCDNATMLKREIKRLKAILESKQTEIDILFKNQTASLQTVQADHEKKIHQLELTHQEVVKQLYSQLQSLKSELILTKSTTAQLAQIRASLEREKEIDILQAKKEIFRQKERQLTELRRDMARETEEVERRWREELNRRDEQYLKSKKQWSEKMQEANRKIKEYVRERADLDNNLKGQDMKELLNKAEAEITNLRVSTNKITRHLNYVVAQLGHGPIIKDLAPLDAIDWLKGQLEDKEATIQSLERQKNILKDQIEAAGRNQDADLKKGVINVLTTERDWECEKTRLELHHKENINKALQVIDGELKVKDRGIVSTQNSCGKVLAPLLPSPTHDLQTLLAFYPLQFASFKSTIESTHAKTLANIRAQNDAAVADLISRFSTEKRVMIEQHEHDLVSLKDKYQRGFEKAIKKFTDNPKRLDVEFSIMIEKAKEEKAREIEDRCKLEQEMKEQKWEREYQMLRDKLNQAEEKRETQIVALKTELDNINAENINLRQSHLKLQSNAPDQNTQALRASYKIALKEIRERVAQSKKRHLEQLEREWVRRKEDIESEWTRKLQYTSTQYESELAQLRKSATAAAQVLYGVIGVSPRILKSSSGDGQENSFGNSESLSKVVEVFGIGVSPIGQEKAKGVATVDASE